MRPEALLVYGSGRLAGKHLAQRRAVERREGIGEAGSRRFEQCATFLHVPCDVGEIELRDDAAARIAVEDDEVELLELHLEEFANREGDQRQFADRRRVLLLRDRKRAV